MSNWSCSDEEAPEPPNARGQVGNFYRPSRCSIFLTIDSALFLFSFLVFFTSRVNSTWLDSMYSMAVSESILKNHTPALNQVSIPDLNIATLPSHPSLIEWRPHYQLVRIDGKVLYTFPHGSSILSLPFVALMNTAGISAIRSDGSYDFRGELWIQKTIAALLMASLAVVFFKTASLTLPISWSLILAAGGAFGTQIWSTASRALWSQTWEVFLAGCVVLVLVRAEERRARLNPSLLATLVSWMYFVRPNGAATVVGVTIFVVLFYPDALLTYLSTGAAWLAAFFTYSWLTFGQVIPDYYRQGSFLALSNFKIALAGVLISPSRGLFVFVPAIPFVLYLVARHWRDMPHRRLALLAVGIISIQVVLVASWPKWWGGWSYGPRLLTDTVPWFGLLAVLGCKALLNYCKRPEVHSSQPNYQRFAVAIGLLLITLAITINSAGALSNQTSWWNARPNNIDIDPARLWDWGSPQFLASPAVSLLTLTALLLVLAAAYLHHVVEDALRRARRFGQPN